MSVAGTVATIEAVNAMLTMTNTAINALVTAQKMAQAIANSQSTGKPIDATEWTALDAQSAADDARIKTIDQQPV